MRSGGSRSCSRTMSASTSLGCPPRDVTTSARVRSPTIASWRWVRGKSDRTGESHTSRARARQASSTSRRRLVAASAPARSCEAQVQERWCVGQVHRDVERSGRDLGEHAGALALGPLRLLQQGRRVVGVAAADAELRPRAPHAGGTEAPVDPLDVALLGLEGVQLRDELHDGTAAGHQRRRQHPRLVVVGRPARTGRPRASTSAKLVDRPSSPARTQAPRPRSADGSHHSDGSR